MKLMTMCALLCLSLSGCAGFGFDSGFQARVIEYGADGEGFFAGAKVGGCSANVVESEPSASGKSSVNVTLTYTGKSCNAEIKSK